MSVILACNAGSHNTKLAAFDVESGERRAHTQAHSLEQTLEWICSVGTLEITAVGHRVVHGGQHYSEPVALSDDIIDELQQLTPLAPLHQPAALRLIDEARRLYPNVPHIACFDTAFHHNVPERESWLALPRRYHEQGMRRYGFHGLSYQHASLALPKLAGERARGRVIVAHLGGGSSACAMHELKSVATTMGFSTLDGMMMGTRPGALDAGVLLYLLQEQKLPLSALEELLYKQSGLLGVSGISGDMEQLIRHDSDAAKEAVELYCYLAAKQIASLMPALGGLDILAFSGGIGEHNDAVRNKIIEHLQWIGEFETFVLSCNEEQVIADACRKLVA